MIPFVDMISCPTIQYSYFAIIYCKNIKSEGKKLSIIFVIYRSRSKKKLIYMWMRKLENDVRSRQEAAIMDTFLHSFSFVVVWRNSWVGNRENEMVLIPFMCLKNQLCNMGSLLDPAIYIYQEARNLYIVQRYISCIDIHHE